MILSSESAQFSRIPASSMNNAINAMFVPGFGVLDAVAPNLSHRLPMIRYYEGGNLVQAHLSDDRYWRLLTNGRRRKLPAGVLFNETSDNPRRVGFVQEINGYVRRLHFGGDRSATVSRYDGELWVEQAMSWQISQDRNPARLSRASSRLFYSNPTIDYSEVEIRSDSIVGLMERLGMNGKHLADAATEIAMNTMSAYGTTERGYFARMICSRVGGRSVRRSPVLRINKANAALPQSTHRLHNDMLWAAGLSVWRKGRFQFDFGQFENGTSFFAKLRFKEPEKTEAPGAIARRVLPENISDINWFERDDAIFGMVNERGINPTNPAEKPDDYWEPRGVTF